MVLGKDLKITGFSFGGGGGAQGETLITIYPEQEVGRVREDFYGANTHGIWLKERTTRYKSLIGKHL